MILFIPDVLTPQELHAILEGLQQAPFVEGATTAGGAAKSVKHNQQMAPNTAQHKQLAQIVRTAFMRNATLQTALLPASVTTVMFNRYATGMDYGPHVDSAIMGVMGNMLRTDIAMTLFLSDPESYVGGELTVKAGDSAEHKFKGPAGSAVAYPANSLHHVSPVSEGKRDAAIFWMQSLVRDADKRQILWDLETAEQDTYRREGRTPTFEAISRSHVNLLRMWTEL